MQEALHAAAPATSNALAGILYATGRGARDCFNLPSNSTKYGGGGEWCNDDTLAADTTATCELAHPGPGLFTAVTPLLFCITVTPALTQGKSFPAVCVVGLATAGQRLDAIAARDVVVKEWRLAGDADRRTGGACRLLLPLRTLYNIASVLSPERISDETRVFVTLRFLGDSYDNSNEDSSSPRRHAFAAVRLTYIHGPGGLEEETAAAEASHAQRQQQQQLSRQHHTKHNRTRQQWSGRDTCVNDDTAAVPAEADVSVEVIRMRSGPAGRDGGSSTTTASGRDMSSGNPDDDYKNSDTYSGSEGREGAAGSASPPPCRRASTVPRPSEEADSRGSGGGGGASDAASTASSTVIEVSESDYDNGEWPPEDESPRHQQRKAAPSPSPQQRRLIAAPEASSLCEDDSPHAVPPPPPPVLWPQEWITSIDDEGFTVAGGAGAANTSATRARREAPPADRMARLRQRQRQQRHPNATSNTATFTSGGGGGDAASSSFSVDASLSAQQQQQQHTSGTGLLRAASLLGLSAQSLWARGAASDGSKNSRRSRSHDHGRASFLPSAPSSRGGSSCPRCGSVDGNPHDDRGDTDGCAAADHDHNDAVGWSKQVGSSSTGSSEGMRARTWTALLSSALPTDMEPTRQRSASTQTDRSEDSDGSSSSSRRQHPVRAAAAPPPSGPARRDASTTTTTSASASNTGTSPAASGWRSAASDSASTAGVRMRPVLRRPQASRPSATTATAVTAAPRHSDPAAPTAAASRDSGVPRWGRSDSGSSSMSDGGPHSSAAANGRGSRVHTPSRFVPKLRLNSGSGASKAEVSFPSPRQQQRQQLQQLAVLRDVTNRRWDDRWDDTMTSAKGKSSNWSVDPHNSIVAPNANANTATAASSRGNDGRNERHRQPPLAAATAATPISSGGAQAENNSRDHSKDKTKKRNTKRDETTAEAKPSTALVIAAAAATPPELPVGHHHRDLFGGSSVPMEDTPMGPADYVGHSAGLTPIACRLAQQRHEQHLMEAPPLMPPPAAARDSRADISGRALPLPWRGGGGAVVAPLVVPRVVPEHTPERHRGEAVPRDTYWLLTRPREGAAGQADGDGDGDGVMLPPPPPRLALAPLAVSDIPERRRRGGNGSSTRRSKSSAASTATTMLPTPPPLPLKESPAGRQMRLPSSHASEPSPPPPPQQRPPLPPSAFTANSSINSSGAMHGSFLVHKHHASRVGTGRRILSIQRSIDPSAAGAQGVTTTVAMQKVSGKGIVASLFGGLSSSSRHRSSRSHSRGSSSSHGDSEATTTASDADSHDGEYKGSTRRTIAEHGSGECRVTIGPEDVLEVQTGLLAYHGGAIHRARVREPTRCLVVRSNRRLIAAVELSSAEELQLAKAILGATAVYP